MLSLKSILYPFKMLWGSTVFRKYDTVLLCVCLFLAGTGWTLLAHIIVYAKIMQMEKSTLKNSLSITLYLDIMFRSTKTRQKKRKCSYEGNMNQHNECQVQNTTFSLMSLFLFGKWMWAQHGFSVWLLSGGWTFFFSVSVGGTECEGWRGDLF